MKIIRHTFLLFAAAAFAVSAQAQESSNTGAEDLGVFKHLGADISVGTEGISVDVATPVTNYLELGFGVNFMPGIKITGDIDTEDINASYTIGGVTQTYNIPLDGVDIQGKLARTTWNFKASVYPFGRRNDLFVAAGLSFGGKKIAKLSGHNDEIGRFLRGEAPYDQLPADATRQVNAEIDKYEVEFNENGDATGDVRVHAVRPYVGLGYGRMVPKHHRFGFRVELGCQFMGKMKIYQNNKEMNLSQIYEETGEKAADDLSDFIDKFTVYPVLKFSLTGRIL